MVRQIVDAVGAALSRLGYAFFQNGDYNLNLVGIRADRRKAGSFDDNMLCLYKVDGIWRVHMWAITTDPASRLLQKPINKDGAAILASPQQCRGAYVIGLHKGRPALVQHGAAVKVWRDNNFDDLLDWGNDTGVAGWYGINIHDTHPSGPAIAHANKSASAGCQVFAARHEQRTMMELAKLAVGVYGPKLTYTLLNESDI